MESCLTAAETVELEGLRKRNALGKVAPGSDEQRRLLALTKVAEGEPRSVLEIARPVAVKSAKDRQSFYGIAERCYYDLEKIGRSAADPAPWDEPEKMRDWFARMKSAGHRKHPPPGRVLQRCDEARLGHARSEKPAPAEAPSPVLDPMHLGEAASTDEILDRYLRIAGALGTKYEEAAAMGDLEKARSYRAEMDTVTDRIRQWSLNAAKLREAEGWVRPDHFSATARQFAAQVWRLLKDAILTEFPAEQKTAVTAAIERFAQRIPDIIPSDLRRVVEHPA